MEFRYRSGEQRDSLSSSSSSFSFSSSSYFAKQALRAGIVPSTMSRTEALIEELRMERIREEILDREIAHKRMLEEEILRELEIESRFENERFLPLEMESRVRERSEPSFMDKYLEIREKERSPCCRDIKMDGIEGSVGAFEKPIASRRAMVEKLGLDKVLLKNETLRSTDNKLSDQKVSSIKRKAAIELPRLAQKEWSCSLCHVTATSQKNLDVHLRGKKHKVKEVQLTNNKATSNNSNTSSSSFKKDNTVPPDQAKDTEGKKQEYKKRPSTVWCNLCKLKCNSPAMLDCHLSGRKHKAQMESMKGDGGNATTPTTEVVKEVTDQKEIQVEIKAEEDDAKVNGEEASNKTLVSSWE